MREVVVAANWKMHTTPEDAGELARTIASRTREAGVTRVICPPFVALSAVRDALAAADPAVAIGAQTVHHELAGAHTGEISAPMLAGLATWVIVGHLSSPSLNHSNVTLVVRSYTQPLNTKTGAVPAANL
jgi:triosephosphate isomerase